MRASSSLPAVYAIATMDTKGDEIRYVAERIRAVGAATRIVNVGIRSSDEAGAEIGRAEIASRHPEGAEAVFAQTDRAQAIGEMSLALTNFLQEAYFAGKMSAVIGLGGGGGTSLITRAMRALPIGIPKLMVSTMASGDASRYVDCSDIIMMPAVADIAGINRISSQVLGNAAHAIAGMALHRSINGKDQRDEATPKYTVAMTMFGVTTPCVDAARKMLESKGNECLVFAATGVGGRTMEKLVESGFVDAVLDITTTEVCDEIVGGVLSAGPERLDRIIAKRIPYVMSLGALDMVNFGAPDTVPEKFRGRTFHAHNSEVTLMRTTADENRQMARWIASKVNTATAPLLILIPEQGVSMLDRPGSVFYDPAADAALFEELENAVHQDSIRQIRRLPLHINDPEFARALVEAHFELRSKRTAGASGT